MRLVSVYFDRKGTEGAYSRCLRVWEYSARQNSGAVAVDAIPIEPPKSKAEDPYNFDANHAKLEVWRDYVREHDDDVVLMDADTLVLRDLTHVFEQRNFDVAVTIRQGCGHLTINGGVVFVANSGKAKATIDAWYEADTKLRGDRRLHEKFRQRYGGMNQASYGYLVERCAVPGKIFELSCNKYNQVDWFRGHSKNPCVIHYKGALRMVTLGPKDTQSIRYQLREAARVWREYEEAALADNRG